MTEMEKLKDRLTGVKNFHVDLTRPGEPGYRPSTAEEIATSLNASLDEIGRGECEIVEDFED